MTKPIVSSKGITAKTHARITFLLLALSAGMGVLSSFYWFTVLEPQLTEKAEITARALAKAQLPEIIRVLDRPGLMNMEAESYADHLSESDNYGELKTIQRDLDNAVKKLLLLHDPETGDSFILGFSLEIDYGVVPVKKKSLDISVGKTEGCFLSEIPLYSGRTGELTGIARICNSRTFFDNFKKDVERTFFMGVSAVFILLISVWRIVSGMLKKLREADRKIAEKNAQITHAGRLSAMGEMATGIAHEINQPLSIISVTGEGLVAYFNKNDPGSMEAAAAKAVLEQVDRMDAVITNMRSFVRTDAEDPEPMDIRKPVEDGLSFFREQFRVHDISLVVEMPDEPVTVKVNPRKFEQIVVNFLSNARYAVDKKNGFSPDHKKKITVLLNHNHKTGKGVLQISDNGVGMTRDVLSRCLEPFYTTKPVGEGTGLGLSIAASIASEFNMTVKADSVEGEGTKISLNFFLYKI